MNVQLPRRTIISFVMSALAFLVLFVDSNWKSDHIVSAAVGEPNLRIFGIGFPAGARTSSDSTELPVIMSEDSRHARFRLTISVRNYGSAPGRYKLQVIAGRARSAASPVYEVVNGVARREPYDIDLDFGADNTGTTVYLPPRNPVRASLLLFDGDGREIERRDFYLILRFPTVTPPRVPLRTDLTVETASLIYTPARAEGLVRILPSVTASMTIRNVGSETWGFRGDAVLHLQLGTPETRLEELGDAGMPTEKVLPIPTGISRREIETVSGHLETRYRNLSPFGDRIIRRTPPLRPGTWYTLTAYTSSEADLDPTNDSVRFVFMLNDDMSIRESRTVRVTNRVRVIR